jgi:Domain of unknown function DUF29
MRDAAWREGVWLDARAEARKETGLAEEALPEACPWTMEQAADAAPRAVQAPAERLDCGVAAKIRPRPSSPCSPSLFARR